MYELEDERPIPLGRAATPAAASAAHAEAPSVVEPAVEAQPVMTGRRDRAAASGRGRA